MIVYFICKFKIIFERNLKKWDINPESMQKSEICDQIDIWDGKIGHNTIQLFSVQARSSATVMMSSAIVMTSAQMR
jgi:hypothetical protein